MTPETSRIMGQLVQHALATGIDLDQRGVVYLLHFDHRLSHAQHYLGATTRRLGVRLTEHLAGYRHGSKLVAAVVAAGIGVRVARVWPGLYGQERRLKRWKKSRQLCPICRAQEARQTAAGGAAPSRGATAEAAG
ncbi:MAG: hypothetical protein IT340_22040 [Chloroflexi bacterium]|nr:hypothetical protein [Chloroflexota bacterium]